MHRAARPCEDPCSSITERCNHFSFNGSRRHELPWLINIAVALLLAFVGGLLASRTGLPILVGQPHGQAAIGWLVIVRRTLLQLGFPLSKVQKYADAVRGDYYDTSINTAPER